MRILIDGRTIREKPTGVGSVNFNLIEQLLKKDDVEIVLITRKGLKDVPGLEAVTIIESNYDYQFAGLKRFWFEQVYIPKIIKKFKPDIVHFTDSFGVPFFLPPKTKIVLTIHDLIPLIKYHEFMSYSDRLLYKLSIANSIKKANRITCISAFTENDIYEYFPTVKNGSITVIHNGVTIPDKVSVESPSVLPKYNITKPYVLYVGGFSPRKNILNTIKGFELFNKKNNNRFQLILSGRFSNASEIKQNLQKIRQYLNEKKLTNSIILLDYLDFNEKSYLIEHAHMFVYLSVYEGFGLPVLEALTSGVPVITSKDSAMQEIAKEYAIFAEPTDIQDICNSMQMCLTNYDQYKKEAIHASKLIPKQFSWEQMGEKYYKLYKSLL